ncbi:hypothetical protein [Mesorhizobium humile]|uniref:Uncharacterized protein n=1 Tax=Mesorhizobium humile TaxID=3072313 RepID=A0ABU4YMB2_9HYPH|nr:MULTISPECIES: hypothetical protein [unclassified Mesorhizobium]MDX8457281.1 hypothetical protein [Mesorhizobium sp. VK2D]MDX8487074.1 hypothetical protein [Mesorhizobium sp. VK2B]
MNIFGENRWLVFVLPGFVALFVASFVSNLPEIPDSHLPIIYVALTTLSAVIPLGITHIYGIASGKKFELQSVLYSKYFVTSVFLCSLLLGLLFGIANSTDYFSAKLREVFGKDEILKASQSDLLSFLLKNAYNSKFVDGQPHVVDKDTNRYARIKLSNESFSYEGVVTQFSVDPDDTEIYLSPACTIKKGKATLIKGPGVWLNMKDSKEIQFIYSICSICAAQVEISAGLPAPDTCPFH